MIVKFALQGEMPSKKNNWKPRAGGGMYVPEPIRTQLDDFLWQMKPVVRKYGKALPIAHPVRISARFATNDNEDLDNKFTTLLDLLQKGNVILNDRQVVHISNVIREESRNPQVMVEVEEINEEE